MSVRQHDPKQDPHIPPRMDFGQFAAGWKWEEPSDRSYGLSDEKPQASYLFDANLCI